MIEKVLTPFNTPIITNHTLIIINTNLITTLVIIVRYFNIAVCSVVQDDRSLGGARRSIMSHHLKMESVDLWEIQMMSNLSYCQSVGCW